MTFYKLELRKHKHYTYVKIIRKHKAIYVHNKPSIIPYRLFSFLQTSICKSPNNAASRLLTRVTKLSHACANTCRQPLRPWCASVSMWILYASWTPWS